MGREGFLEEMALEVGLERRCRTGMVRWREGTAQETRGLKLQDVFRELCDGVQGI